jgi:WD40 repeat protein
VKKKILILTANPRNSDPLRLDKEAREIEEGLRRANRRDGFEIKTKWAVRAQDLRRSLLDETPHIVHFSGHGAGGDGLALEDDAGQVQLVSSAALAQLFGLFKDRLECVLLNACYSEVQAEAIHQQINCVMGMNQAIGDRAAIEFAVGFYDALGAGRSYADAFEFGRNAIAMEGISESATPVLMFKPDRSTPPSAKYKKQTIFNSIHRYIFNHKSAKLLLVTLVSLASFFFFYFNSSIILIKNIQTSNCYAINSQIPTSNDITSMDFSKDGKYLVTAGTDGISRIFEIRGRDICKIDIDSVKKHRKGYTNVKFNPSKDQFISGGADGKIILNNFKTTNTANNFSKDLKSDITSMSFSPNEKYFAASTKEGIIMIWNSDDSIFKNVITFSSNNDFIQEIAFSSDSKYMAANYLNSPPRIWKLEADKDNIIKFELLKDTNRVLQSPSKVIAFSPSTLKVNYLAIYVDEGIRILILKDDQIQLYKNSDFNDEINQLFFSPDGKTIAISSFTSSQPVRLWKWQEQPLPEAPISTEGTSILAFSLNGEYLAIANHEGQIKVPLTDNYHKSLSYELSGEPALIKFKPSKEGNTKQTLVVANIEGIIKFIEIDK